jgi:hypothetical protein
MNLTRAHVGCAFAFLGLLLLCACPEAFADLPPPPPTPGCDAGMVWSLALGRCTFEAGTVGSTAQALGFSTGAGLALGFLFGAIASVLTSFRDMTSGI